MLPFWLVPGRCHRRCGDDSDRSAPRPHQGNPSFVPQIPCGACEAIPPGPSRRSRARRRTPRPEGTATLRRWRSVRPGITSMAARRSSGLPRRGACSRPRVFSSWEKPGTPPEACRRRADLQPDVVLLDVMLPDGDGLLVADQMSAIPKPPMVVLTSGRRRRDFGPRLDRCSVRGFVHKGDLSGEVLARLTGGARS